MVVPKTTQRYGGPLASPNPAWFDEAGIVWFRCQCGELLSFGADQVEDDGSITHPIIHGCGFSNTVTLEGWDS